MHKSLEASVFCSTCGFVLTVVVASEPTAKQITNKTAKYRAMVKNTPIQHSTSAVRMSNTCLFFKSESLFPHGT